MTPELKALIEDLRLNHEFCPKEVILQAADELERLAQPEQEPVALMQEADVRMMADVHGINPSTRGLYGFYIDCVSTSPQPAQRTWVDLTETERNDIEDYCEMIIGKAAFDAIEAKLQEKNT